MMDPDKMSERELRQEVRALRERAHLCRTHITNTNKFDPDGCIACQSYTRGYSEAQKHGAVHPT